MKKEGNAFLQGWGYGFAAGIAATVLISEIIEKI
jgi:hypothetical protein